ncbi:MAG: HAD-IIB family hydrolase [Deltaproteobacteria bacterium]
MRLINDIPGEVCQKIQGVFFDIDDSVTTAGHLEGSAYLAIEKLQQAGLLTIPITGRPAGWCDMIARFWPVDGVVGENGAFYFAYDRNSAKMRRCYVRSKEQRLEDQTKLATLKKEILQKVPGSAISADQAYREADLAVDFCEDVAPLPNESVLKIKNIFEDSGAVAKISSIHVNGWFGDYDKLSTCQLFVSSQLGFELSEQREKFIFVGDSPNDEPMFQYFPNAVGVANVQNFINQLEHPPTWVTHQKSGAGFVELVDHLLKNRI